jgi:type I restriction enzyme, S subunit
MQVPEGWENTILSELGTRSRPAVKAGPFGSALKKEFYVEKGYKIYGQEQVIAGDSFHGNYYIDEEKFNSLKSCAVESGDILISLVGTVGRVLIIPDNAEKGIINPRLLRISLNPKKVVANFVKYYLEDGKTKNKLESWAQGGTMGVLNAEMLKALPIPVPPLPEQQNIAQILSTWDRAIEKLEALIAAKKKRKKALMQQLLTGKKRFDGFEGEWKEVRLKKLIKEEKSRNKDYLISRVLSVTNHSGFVLPEEQFSRQVASSDLSNYKIVRKGQFGYNPSRINVGSFARLDTYSEGVLSPMYVVFSIDEKKLDTNFFLNWMDSHEAKQRIISSTQGTVRDSVGFDALSSFLIKLPPIDEQQKISSVLITADQEIETHRNQLAVLKQQKKGLMQQLLTGKKRVKLDEPEQLAEVVEA